MARAVGSSGDRDVSVRRVVLWASHDRFFRWRAARFTIVVGRVPRGLTRANECVNKRVRLSFSGLWPYGIGFSAAIAARLFAPDPLQVVLVPWVIVTLFLKRAVGVNTVSAVGPLPELIPGV
jgi:hypothetical protein